MKKNKVIICHKLKNETEQKKWQKETKKKLYKFNHFMLACPAIICNRKFLININYAILKKKWLQKTLRKKNVVRKKNSMNLLIHRANTTPFAFTNEKLLVLCQDESVVTCSVVDTLT